MNKNLSENFDKNLGKSCIILFIKDPESVPVKTRMQDKFAKDILKGLYKAFVADILITLKNLDYPIIISYYPTDSLENVKRWLGNKYKFLPQKGNDLGENMKNAFVDVFVKGFTNILLIGSDSPDLPVEIFHEAFISLEKADAVIGPALDGGYYLIGFNRGKFLADIFENISWSTSTVFQDTLTIFTKNNYNISKLPEWKDIDDFYDLKSVFESSENNNFSGSETISFIKNNCLIANE